MRRHISILAALFFSVSTAYAGGTANPIHPSFVPLDEGGRPVAETRGSLSPEKTCGRCHDVDYISAHNSHEQAGASCLDCHAEGGKLDVGPSALDRDGKLLREHIRIRTPRSSNCAACHGIIHEGTTPLSPPDDFESSSPSYDITIKTGAVLSPQRISDSFMNLAGKDSLAYPWDLHAARSLMCIDCHFSRNNPARASHKTTGPGYLTFDPRKPGLSDFLHRPDHTLSAADCRACHDPIEAHFSLPFRERHLDVLSCQACHAERLFGPAREVLDETVVDSGGRPLSRYRGFTAPGRPSGGSFTKGFQPYLMPVPSPNPNDTRLAPFNITTRFYWVSGKDGKPVPGEAVKSAFMENGRYRLSILAVFDGDGNGDVSEKELRLDTPEKLSAVKAGLASAGIEDPRIKAEATPYEVGHGTMDGSRIAGDCKACHSRDARLSAEIELAPFSPAGAGLELAGILKAGAIYQGADGRLMMKRPAAEGLYLLGHSRGGYTDGIGFLLLLAVTFGVAVHAGLRWYFGRGRCGGEVPTEKRYTFSIYERIWHWLMALSVVVLIVTGLAIHWIGAAVLIPLPRAVSVHNAAAAIMVLNAGLALFYNLASAAIRRFVPDGRNILRRVTDQVKYYSHGIFFGERHPQIDSFEKHMNPLQQITYLLLLNILFPLQIATGALMYGASRWPDFSDAIGGIGVPAQLHNLGSWLFISFFVMHVYLSTTGHTPTSNIRAMLTGFQEFETGCIERQDEKKGGGA